MLIRHLRHIQPSGSSSAWACSSTIRYVHHSGSFQKKTSQHANLRAQRLSLFDEIFSEKNEQSGTSSTESIRDGLEISRLPLSDLDLFKSHPERSGDLQQSKHEISEKSPERAERKLNPAVLVLSRASKSLIHADFCGVTPPRCNPEGWTASGNIGRVIPGRDPVTFQQRKHYFLLFNEPSHARAYQIHVSKLHRLAFKHTPTSLHSPLPPMAGTIIEGEVAQSFLVDYALCPSSQCISLSPMFAPFGNSVRSLMEHQGYPQLTVPVDRTGRAVLLWFEGHTPTTHAIRTAIDEDGHYKGLPWATYGGSAAIEKLNLPMASSENIDFSESVEPGSKGHSSARWILTFVDENETRRFVRAWHRRAFPVSGHPLPGEVAPTVNAEVLW